MATLIPKPKTKNQRAYNKELERINRFAAKYVGLVVDLPPTPKRITKKDIQNLKNLRGKKILAKSTVIRPIGDFFEGQKAVAQNALAAYSDIVGENVPLSKGEKLFKSQVRAGRDIQTKAGVSFTDNVIKEFHQAVDGHNPAFQRVVHRWEGKMLNLMPKEKFAEHLMRHIADIGNFGAKEFYNLKKLSEWLSKFAERIDDDEVREAALDEIEAIEQDTQIQEEFNNISHFRKPRTRKRGKNNEST